MLKLKMMLCVMMLPLVVVGCTSKQSVSQCTSTTTASGWIKYSLFDWQTPLVGLFHPQRRVITMQNNWKEPRSILMSSADRVAHIGRRSSEYCEQYTRASSGV